MNKRLMTLIGLIILVIAVFFIFVKDDVPLNPGKNTGSGGISTPPVAMTYDNLDDYMSNNIIVKELPDDVVMLLKFYNFDSGEREWEKTFVIEKARVYEGSVDNPDLIILLHSKYLAEWNNRNFCTIMTKASNNGDLGYESSLSTVELAWKFKSLMEYKDCFGG